MCEGFDPSNSDIPAIHPGHPIHNTAAYAVVGVSQLDCLSSRREAQRMAQSTQEGTRRFIESRSR